MLRDHTVGVAPLINHVEFGGLLGDKAFDSDAIIADLDERGAKVVISQHPRRASPRQIDTEVYKWRHLMQTSSANSASMAKAAVATASSS